MKFFEEIRPLKDTTILVVTHEETMRVMYAYFYGLDPEEMLQLNFGNCEFLTFTM